MSNFNVPAPNASRSAISLGGEWRNRDQMEANKYKMSGLAQLHKKKTGKVAVKDKEKSRPRSTPTSQQLDVEDDDAPKSAPPGSRPRCSRVNEVESPEPTARKSLENHLPLKRTLGSGRSEENSRQYDLGPGMVLTKSKSRVAVTISTGGGDTPPPVIRRFVPEAPVGDPAKDALIAQLQQQVSDLTLYLEEERMNHKSSKERAAALLREKLKELDKKHTEKFRRYQEDQEEQVEMLKELHAKESNHLKSASEKNLARMKGELEFLQGAFEAYKGTLTQDMIEKWTKKESDMKIKFQEELEKTVSEQRAQLIEERNREKKAMNREFQKQIHLMTQEHKKEIDNMMKRFSSASSDVENLRKALDQLKAVRTELEETLDALALSEDQARRWKNESTETKLKLLDYQENFKGKVDEVDEKYKERIHHLMTENAELRKRYMQKCNELFNEKSQTEYKRVEKVMNTKEMMQMLVHVRNRSNVSMACSDPAADSQPRLPVSRPISAPVTRREATKAHRMAGETDHLMTSTTSLGLQRPHTTNVGARPRPPGESQNFNPFGSLHSLNSLSSL